MADLSVTGEVSLSSEKAEATFDRLGNKAGQMASKVQAEATKAGTAVDGIGAGAERGAEKFTRAESRMREAIMKSTRELEMLGKTASQKFEANLEFKGLDRAKFEPFLADLRKAEQATKEVESGLAGMGNAAAMAGRAFAAIGLGVSVREFVRLADASTNVESRLRLVTSSAADLASVQQKLFAVAQSSRVSFVDLAGTYAQVARSTKDLGVSQNALLGVIQTISQAVTISGGSAASAQAALTQLSQGFASGALRGEELNSILEQTPRLAQAIADGLGVSVGKLRELGQAGELTAEKVLGALEKSASSVANEFGKMTVTVEQASINASNSILRLTGAFDRLLGVTSAVSKSITAVSEGFDFFSRDIEKLGSQGPLRDASREVINLEAAAQRLRNGMASGVLGPNAQGELERINARLAEAKQRFRELDSQLSGTRDPRDQTGFTGRGASYANEAKRLSQLADDKNKFLLNQSGVPASYLKEMQELIRLNQAGVLVGKEYTDALKKQQDELLKKTGAVKASNTAANQEQNTYETLIASIRAKIEADKLELAGGAALTESQKIRIKLDQDLAAGKIALGSAREKEIRLAIDELATAEAALLAQQTIAKANLAAATSREKYVASLATGLDKIRADITAQEEATARMGLTKEAIADLDAAKLEMLATDLELQAIKAMDRNLDQQTYDALKLQAEAYRDLAAAKRDGASKEMWIDSEKAAADAAKKAADDWQRTADDINRSLTDALLRGFESGKGFAKNLRDSLVNMFKTMVLRPIISAIVNPVAGAIAGALGLAGPAAAAANGASTLSSLTGSMSGLTNAFARFAGSSVGQSLGLSNTSAIAGNNPSAYVPAGGQLTGVGQSIGSALGVVGNTLAGYALGSMARSLISGGYSLGKGMDTFQKVGIAVGSAIGGPVMGAIIGAAAGVINRLFGRKLKDTGIQGTFGGESGFEGESYQFYQGGLFRSDKTKTSPLAEELRKTLGDAFAVMRAEVGTFATLLGLDAKRLEGFSTSLKLSLQGLDEKGVQAKIEEALATANNELAEQVIGSWQRTSKTISRTISTNIGANAEGGDYVTSTFDEVVTSTSYVASEFARDGEKAIDTLRRLATSLATTNDAFGFLGVTLLDASLSGGAAASALVDAFGGLERMAALTRDYYQNYYTEEERRAKKQEALDKGFADLGINTPGSRDELRGLITDQLNQVEAQRKNRESLVGTVSSSIASMGKGGVSAADLGKLGFSNIDPALLGGTADPKQQEKLRKFIDGINGLGGKGLDDEAFRKGIAGLVDANAEILGLGDDAGKTAAALLGLSGAFAELNESADQAAERIRKEQADAREKAFRGLERAIEKEKSALQAQMDVASEVASTMQGLFDLLHDSVRDLYAEVDSTRAQQAQQGAEFIAQALQTALASGYLPEQSQLAEAISGARGGLDSSNYSSQFELDRDRLILAGQLSQLEEVAGKQLTDAQKTLRELEDQSKQLDETLEYWREQIDIANGTFEATVSVEQAIKDLTALMFPETNLKAPEKLPSGGGFSIGGGGGGGGGPSKPGSGFFGALGTEINDPATVARLTSIRDYTRTLDFSDANKPAAVAELGRQAAIYGVHYREIAIANGYPPEDVARMFEEAGVPVPRYEIGTNYVPRTGFALLHEGEAVVPKAYNPAAGGAGGGRMEALLESLVEQNTRLEIRLAAIEGHTQDTSRATNGNPVSPVPTALMENLTV